MKHFIGIGRCLVFGAIVFMTSCGSKNIDIEKDAKLYPGQHYKMQIICDCQAKYHVECFLDGVAPAPAPNEAGGYENNADYIIAGWDVSDMKGAPCQYKVHGENESITWACNNCGKTLTVTADEICVPQNRY